MTEAPRYHAARLRFWLIYWPALVAAWIGAGLVALAVGIGLALAQGVPGVLALLSGWEFMKAGASHAVFPGLIGAGIVAYPLAGLRRHGVLRAMLIGALLAAAVGFFEAGLSPWLLAAMGCGALGGLLADLAGRGVLALCSLFGSFGDETE